MPTKKKRANLPLKSTKLNPVILGLTALTIIVIGFFLFRSEAAAPAGTPVPKYGQLSLSYRHEVPRRLSRNNSGVVTAESASRSIEVSKDGTVYCLPENAEYGTSKQLSPNDLAQLRKTFLQTGGTDVASVPASVTAYSSLTYVTDGDDQSGKTVVIADGTETPTAFKQAQTILEVACSGASDTLDRKGKPSFDLPYTSKPAATSSILDSIRHAIIHRAYAATGNPTVASDIFNATNTTRAQNGLRGLANDDCLQHSFAEPWAQKLAEVDDARNAATTPTPWLDHNPATNTISICNNVANVISENVGRGGTSGQIWSAFMNSPLHKANILDSRFTHQGIGAWTSNKGIVFVAHNFLACRYTYAANASCTAPATGTKTK